MHAIRIVAGLVAVTLGALALLHLYWAAGGAWGGQAAVPERAGAPLFVPSATACVVVAALLSSAAALVCLRAVGWAPRFFPRATQIGVLGVALVFVGRAVGDFRWIGFFKRERASRFAQLDSRVYSPLCLALGLGALFVALY